MKQTKLGIIFLLSLLTTMGAVSCGIESKADSQSVFIEVPSPTMGFRCFVLTKDGNTMTGNCVKE